jgi:hypothetical protein
MSIFRNLADRIELYDPDSGFPWLHYDRSEDEVVHESPFRSDSGRITGDIDLTVNVPSDVGTLNDALDLASQYVHPRDDVNVKVNIESGHTITQRASMSDGYYGYIQIVSEEAIVDASGIGSNDRLFNFSGCVSPIIDAQFDMQGSGAQGVFITDCSIVRFEEDAGIINSGGRNLYTSQSSRVHVTDAVFSGADDAGIYAQNGSIVTGVRVDVSNCSDRGLGVSRGAFYSGKEVNATNCGIGIDVRRSWAYVEDSDVSGASSIGLINRWGSQTSALNLQADDCAAGISSRHGSIVTTRNATFDNPGNKAVETEKGGVVTAENSTVTNLSGDFTYAFAAEGGRIYGTESTIDSNPDSNEIATTKGGVISAHGTTIGGNSVSSSNTNITPNEVNSLGIIFL